MNILMSVILKEQTRNEYMMAEYSKELENLPKGKIVKKNIKGNTYYYLYYRNNKKVVSKYIGKDDKIIEDLQEKLKRRLQVEEIIRLLKKENRKIKKIEELL